MDPWAGILREITSEYRESQITLKNGENELMKFYSRMNPARN